MEETKQEIDSISEDSIGSLHSEKNPLCRPIYSIMREALYITDPRTLITYKKVEYNFKKHDSRHHDYSTGILTRNNRFFMCGRDENIGIFMFEYCRDKEKFFKKHISGKECYQDSLVEFREECILSSGGQSTRLPFLKNCEVYSIELDVWKKLLH